MRFIFGYLKIQQSTKTSLYGELQFVVHLLNTTMRFGKELSANMIFFLLQITTLIVAATAWADGQRYGGYDLDRGPVFYEPSQNDENLNDSPMVERSYQLQEVPYENSYLEKPVDTFRKVYSSSLMRNYEPDLVNVAERRHAGAGYYIPKSWDPQEFSTEGLGFHRDSPIRAKPASSLNDPWYVPSPYPDKQLVFERRVRTLPEEISDMSLNYPARDASSGSDAWNPIVYERNSFDDEDLRNLRRYVDRLDARRRDSFERYPETYGNSQNAVRISDAKLEYPGQVVQPKVPSEAIEKGQEENIFEPRPQILSYVLSSRSNPSSYKSEDDNPTKSGDTVKKVITREWPTERQGNPSDLTKRVVNDEENQAKVASIEVSEVHHKTRHHHGEWPRRNYKQH